MLLLAIGLLLFMTYVILESVDIYGFRPLTKMEETWGDFGAFLNLWAVFVP